MILREEVRIDATSCHKYCGAVANLYVVVESVNKNAEGIKVIM